MRGISLRSALGPTTFAVVGVLLLVYDHLNKRVTELVFWLTLALIVAIWGRMIETVRNQTLALRMARRRSEIDPVTGLRNRDGLIADLERAAASPGDRRVLLVFELDGLQTYSDRFGYAAGDELLRRSAHGLLEAVAPLDGVAYRIDADRIAALVPLGGRQFGEVVLAATASLREEESDPLIGRSYGEAAIPDEAATADLAFQIAGQRLDAHKQRQHRSARRQAYAVLMAALAARRPELRDRLRVVAYRAISLGRRLGAGVAELDDIALAAELREVGELVAPPAATGVSATANGNGDARHSPTLDSERIVSAAPGLASVARLVRASAEHFDGSGSPDRLAGDAIPLGGRVVAVAASFVELTHPLPGEAARSGEQAVAELRRLSGTRFDPRVVNALAGEIAEETAAGPPAPAPTPA